MQFCSLLKQWKSFFAAMHFPRAKMIINVSRFNLCHYNSSKPPKKFLPTNTFDKSRIILKINFITVLKTASKPCRNVCLFLWERWIDKLSKVQGNRAWIMRVWDILLLKWCIKSIFCKAFFLVKLFTWPLSQFTI